MPLSDDLKSIKHERLIGAIALRWTHLENAIQTMFWAIAGLDARTGRCITQHMSFRALCDAVLSMSHETPKYKIHYPQVKELLANADRLRVERNNQVHAIWGIVLGENSPKVVQGNEVTGLLIKARGKLNSTVLYTTIENIEKTLEEIELCNNAIYELTHQAFDNVSRSSDDKT